MKKIILFLVINLASIYCFSQEVYKKHYDTKHLEGTWVATAGNKSYEITFVKGTIYERDLKMTLESIFGSINYLENNEIIKRTDINSLESVRLMVFQRSDGLEYEVHYSEKDNKQEIFGKVNFDISADGKTAHWYGLRKRPLLRSTKETFDIPKELTFTKKPSTKSQSNQPAPHFEFPLKK